MCVCHFQEVYWCDISARYIYMSATDSLHLWGYFFSSQLCLRFQPKEKIVSCVMSRETSWNNLSVCRAVCRSSISSLWSDDQSIQTYEEICRSINAMVKRLVYMVKWYHPGCLPVIVTIWSSSFLQQRPCRLTAELTAHRPASSYRQCGERVKTPGRTLKWKLCQTILRNIRARVHLMLLKF